jgi:hypothetical protein
MNRFTVKSLLALGLLIALVSFNACQKDNLQVADTTGTPSLSATDRAPLMYGVTLYGGPGKPSRLIELNVGTGAITNGPTQVFYDNGGVPVNLDDLKGVCIVNGQVFVTTGPACPFPYANALIKVSPATGQAGFISSGPAGFGAVSDIDYDEQTGTIYGLLNNTNTLVSITDNGNNWGTWLNIGPITNLGTYVAKGLSMVRDGSGTYITIAASTNSALNTTRVFSVPATAGFANFLASINPLSEMNQSHCGIGFQIAINSMIINRGPTVTVAGLNAFAWTNPLPNPSNSALWGGVGFIFEDLSSAIQ